MAKTQDGATTITNHLNDHETRPQRRWMADNDERTTKQLHRYEAMTKRAFRKKRKKEKQITNKHYPPNSAH
jgi:spore cortex formation protein SpoVR/YcgB (stage V sporulation)